MVKATRLHTFPRSCRLLQSSEFDRLYKRGQRVMTRYFVLYGLEADQVGVRLGLTVSRKIGNAVQRNRIKRMLREIFRRYRSLLFDGPYDVVINARRGIDTIPYSVLEAAFCQAVAQLKTNRPGNRPKTQ